MSSLRVILKVNRVLLKPVLRAVATVALFITGHEQTQFNRVYDTDSPVGETEQLNFIAGIEVRHKTRNYSKM